MYMHDRKNTTFIKAVRFIYHNIDQPMQLEELAEAAAIYFVFPKKDLCSSDS